MLAELSLNENNCLCVECEGASYRAPVVFDAAKIASEKAFGQGLRLLAALPPEFPPLVSERCAEADSGAPAVKEPLVLVLKSPELAAFRWEYVPIRKNSEKLIRYTWQALPLLRCVPDTKPGYRTQQEDQEGEEGSQTESWGFVHDLDLPVTSPFNPIDNRAYVLQIPGKTNSDEIEKFKSARKDDMAIINRQSLQKKLFKIMDNDLIYIVLHGKEDALLLSPGGISLLEAAELTSSVSFPRVVLADCCNTGKVPPGKGWGEILAGSFTGESRCAVFVGNIDNAIYIPKKGGTVFSRAFIKEFCQNTADKPFAEHIRRVRLEQSRVRDTKNTQVVYVAGGWDVMTKRSEVLTELELPPPPSQAEPPPPPPPPPQPQPEPKTPWPARALLVASVLSLIPVYYIWLPSHYIPWRSFIASVTGIICGAVFALYSLIKKNNARRKPNVD
jgi:hypothetical protein